MQKTIYACDRCGDEIGSQPHLSLVVSQNGQVSGIALPPTPVIGRWHLARLPNSFLHLHMACIFGFFKDIAKAAVADDKDK